MIIIGSDHAGFGMKEKVKEFLDKRKKEYIDVTKEYVADDDYTDIVESICNKMKENDISIMICGTGIGSSIMANKFKGIRAAICYDEYTARLTRLDNDANMLCLGGRTVLARDDVRLFKIIETFLSTDFSNESRHIRRLEKIKKIEEKEGK